MVWFTITSLNVYDLTGPTETLSTVRPLTVWPLAGVIEKPWLDPLLTDTEPDGEMAPPVPADAVIV